MNAPNQLIQSTSPYLLQHANNPVSWRLWNNENLAKAKAENKLIIVSIGYSACHWCHVMEHECFEDDEVAALMNEYYISIKVDREERPDIDQVYMDACQLITQRGGWPLNAICLPNGLPIYAGTYFPKQNWMKVLEHFQKEFKENVSGLEEHASHILNGIKSFDTIDTNSENKNITSEFRDIIFKNLTQRIDFEYGGTMGAPKFAMPILFQSILEHYAYTKNSKALEAAEIMAKMVLLKGCYDHIEGGFMRYAVDLHWEIPHFEKMLYDNAQLISLYSNLYRIAPNEEYRKIVYQTTLFIQFQWMNEDGGIYAAYDADSEGVEGKYYVHDYATLQSLDESFDGLVKKIFDIDPNGNFEGHIHLNRTEFLQSLADKLGLDKKNIDIQYEKIIAQIASIRKPRIKPGLDNKILCSWNALCIKGFTDAYRAFGDNLYLELAIKNYAYLSQNYLNADGKLTRTKEHQGFLDDYVFMMDAALNLYQQTSESKYLEDLIRIENYATAHFIDKSTPYYFYTSSLDAPLITRKKEISDNVIPASNSIFSKILYSIGLITGDLNYIEKSKAMITGMYETASKHPTFYAGWIAAMNWIIDTPFLIVIIGENALEYVVKLNAYFLPNAIIMPAAEASSFPCFKGKYQNGKTLFYVCKDETCASPLENIQEVLEMVNLGMKKS